MGRNQSSALTGAETKSMVRAKFENGGVKLVPGGWLRTARKMALCAMRRHCQEKNNVLSSMWSE